MGSNGRIRQQGGILVRRVLPPASCGGRRARPASSLLSGRPQRDVCPSAPPLYHHQRASCRAHTPAAGVCASGGASRTSRSNSFVPIPQRGDDLSRAQHRQHQRQQQEQLLVLVLQAALNQVQPGTADTWREQNQHRAPPPALIWRGWPASPWSTLVGAPDGKKRQRVAMSLFVCLSLYVWECSCCVCWARQRWWLHARARAATPFVQHRPAARDV